MGWILVSAIMLCLTSCLNEASDPNSAAGELPGNVATLAEQVASMKTSLSEIESIQTKLAEIFELQGIEVQFGACVTSVNEHIASVEAGMSDVNATIAAMRIQSQIATVVGTLKVQAYSLVNENLVSDILSLEKSVATWLGKDLSNYFVVVSEQAGIISTIETVSAQSLLLEAIASDVEAGLRVGDASDLGDMQYSVNSSLAELSKLNEHMTALCSEVENGYTDAIKSPTPDTNSTLKTLNEKAKTATEQAENTLAGLISRIEACESAIAALEERLEKIEADVAELLGMIQSLTFVSDYSTENAYAYYQMDVNNKVSDNNLPYYGKAQRTATGSMNLTYMVRPAAAAPAIKAVEVIGYYAKTIPTKAPQASDYIDFDITGIEVVNEAQGLVSVTVVPDLCEAFYFKEIGAKCALNVKGGKTDIASSFVEILPKDNSSTIYVTGITLSDRVIEIDKGESYTLSATIAPSEATDNSFYWSSSDESVVTVDPSTGRINAIGVGEATITVTSHGVDEWGLPLATECKVKVNEAFRLSGPSYVEVGCTVDMLLDYPASSVIESRVWKSSDESKATVDSNGKVTGVAHTYSATAKQYNEITISCTINGVTTISKNIVVAAVQPKSIITPALADGQDEITMRVDESLSLASTIYPENVPEGAYRITYQSDQANGWIDFNTGIINYYKNTLSPVTAYVYITVDDSDKEKYYVVGKVRKTVIVHVLPYYVASISFDDVKMELGQTVTLSPKFTSDVDGKAPTNTAVTWRSENEAVATVDQNGVVTSVAPGGVKIIATSTDGSNVSGVCSISITQPWKSFETGDYVVRTASGDIEFAADINTAKSKGSVVGVVVVKTNPRASDPMLPASCTHGVAIALGEGQGKWWSSAPASSPYKVYEWATQNGYQSTMGVDWSSSKGTHRAGTAEMFVGYNNTLALKAFISARGISSEIISALDAYNGPTLPNGASSYYLPSVAEMDAIAAVSNMSWALSNKLFDAGGTKFTNDDYWTVSDSGNSSSNAAKINPLTGALNGAGMKTNSAKCRYVFAF